MDFKDALKGDLNTYTKDILFTPIETNEDSFWTKIKKRRSRRKYYKKYIKRVADSLRENTADFWTLVGFADFIKQMEMIFFYNNSFVNRDNSQRTKENSVYKNILICDNQMNKGNRKVLRILLEELNVIVTFTMYTEGTDQIIDVQVRNNFGNKMTTNYHIVNADTEFLSLSDYNLMYMINHILQNVLADTFLEMYDYAVKTLKKLNIGLKFND